jgi:hypothetical protein
MFLQFMTNKRITCYFTCISGAIVVVIVWCLNLQLPVQSLPITTKVVSLNPVNGKVYLIQHYAIKFVGDLTKVGHKAVQFRQVSL